VTPLTSSMFIFKVIFSLFKYNPHYYFVSCVYYFACYFQLFDYALIFLLFIYLFYWVLLLIIVLHCYYSLAPHCHVLLPFFNFSLLGVIAHCCCAILLLFNSSLLGTTISHYCALLPVFNSSLLSTTTIPLSTSLTCCCSLALHWCALLLFPLIVVVWLLQFGTTPNLCFWANEGEETCNLSFKLNFFKVSFHFIFLCLFLLFFHWVYMSNMCFVNMYVCLDVFLLHMFCMLVVVGLLFLWRVYYSHFTLY